MKLTVGQQLWWVPNHCRHSDKPKFVTVEKVGRKWAQLSSNDRIDVVTLVADGNGHGYTSPGSCYLTREEYESKLAKNRAWLKLHTFIESRSYRGAPDSVTLENIEAAGKLLGFKDI